MSKLKSKIINVNNRRTSVRLCHSEWCAFEDLCREEKLRRNALIETLDNRKTSELGLTGAIRLFSIVYYYRHKKNQHSTPQEIIDSIFIK